MVATARAYNLSETYLCYALAIYCDRAEFDAYHAERGDVACNYDRLWRELNAMVTGSVAALRPDANRDEGVADVGEALGDLASGGADGGAHEAICGFDGVSHGGGYDGGGFDGGGSCD